MKILLKAFLLTALFLLTISGCQKKTPGEQVSIRFGALPVMQALPLFVASDLDYFAREGINVEIIPFNTAADKDIAMASRNLDGQFADLFTPVVIEGNGQDIDIVATNYSTVNDRRMFAVLGKPGGNYNEAKDLKNVPIALSSNTVLHYVTETLMLEGGLASGEIKYLESKNIGMRMQMLLSGQVEAATLPEPLVTAAVARGATIVADDSGLRDSQTVLVFAHGFVIKHPEAVHKFLKAVAKAQSFISQNPDSARVSMVKHVRLPDPLKSTYPVPAFPALTIPSNSSITNAVSWLKEQGAIDKDINYIDLVNAKYLP